MSRVRDYDIKRTTDSPTHHITDHKHLTSVAFRDSNRRSVLFSVRVGQIYMTGAFPSASYTLTQLTRTPTLTLTPILTVINIH